MIASSLKEGDELVDLLLKKGADVNMKSEKHRTSSKEFALLYQSCQEEYSSAEEACCRRL